MTASVRYSGCSRTKVGTEGDGTAVLAAEEKHGAEVAVLSQTLMCVSSSGCMGMKPGALLDIGVIGDRCEMGLTATHEGETGRKKERALAIDWLISMCAPDVQSYRSRMAMTHTRAQRSS